MKIIYGTIFVCSGVLFGGLTGSLIAGIVAGIFCTALVAVVFER